MSQGLIGHEDAGRLAGADNVAKTGFDGGLNRGMVRLAAIAQGRGQIGRADEDAVHAGCFCDGFQVLDAAQGFHLDQ
ncbi:hypothetical protein D3C81_1914000 [compost metagenome]